jgi:hypothetical protein
MIIALLLLVLAVFAVVLVVGIVVRGSGHASSDARHPILSIIPKPAKTIAIILFSLAVVIGTVAGAISFRSPGGPHAWIAGAGVGLAGGLFVGSLFTVWVLALGYVYGDARRRNMPAVPWLLVALFVPNLLGFLLYFVLRKSLARPCPQCGQAITPEQRFCSWCGVQQYAAPYGTAVTPPSPTGLDPGAAG